MRILCAVVSVLFLASSCSDDGGGMCCEIETPSCGCFQIGGTAGPANGCEAICDAEPDGWEMGERNGCPILEFVGGTGSCLAPPDAALPDAATPDAGPPDANRSDAQPA